MSSPIHTLPDEILQKIFYQSLDLNWSQRVAPRVEFESHPLLLTHVCPSWRDLALTTSELWATFALFIPYPDENGEKWKLHYALFDSWLTLAMNQPLHVIVGDRYRQFGDKPIVNDPIYNTYMERLRRQSSQWRRIRLRILGDRPKLLEDLSNKDVPMLEEFIFEQDGGDETGLQLESSQLTFLADAPSLKTLRFDQIATHTYLLGLLQSKSSKLRTLSISTDRFYMWSISLHFAVKLLSVLSTTLVNLRLWYHAMGASDHFRDEADNIPIVMSALENIELQLDAYSGMPGRQCSALEILHILILPRLTSLQVNCLPSESLQSISCFSKPHPSLKKVDLRLYPTLRNSNIIKDDLIRLCRLNPQIEWFGLEYEDRVWDNAPEETYEGLTNVVLGTILYDHTPGFQGPLLPRLRHLTLTHVYGSNKSDLPEETIHFVNSRLSPLSGTVKLDGIRFRAMAFTEKRFGAQTLRAVERWKRSGLNVDIYIGPRKGW